MLYSQIRVMASNYSEDNVGGDVEMGEEATKTMAIEQHADQSEEWMLQNLQLQMMAKLTQEEESASDTDSENLVAVIMESAGSVGQIRELFVVPEQTEGSAKADQIVCSNDYKGQVAESLNRRKRAGTAVNNCGSLTPISKAMGQPVDMLASGQLDEHDQDGVSANQTSNKHADQSIRKRKLTDGSENSSPNKDAGVNDQQQSNNSLFPLFCKKAQDLKDLRDQKEGLKENKETKDGKEKK